MFDFNIKIYGYVSASGVIVWRIMYIVLYNLFFAFTCIQFSQVTKERFQLSVSFNLSADIPVRGPSTLNRIDSSLHIILYFLRFYRVIRKYSVWKKKWHNKLTKMLTNGFSKFYISILTVYLCNKILSTILYI